MVGPNQNKINWYCKVEFKTGENTWRWCKTCLNVKPSIRAVDF